MKLLRETYKTWEGANKRARFENGVAKSEFERGYKAKHYQYKVVPEVPGHFDAWRVARSVKETVS